jgi:predicted nucleotidyltransferase
VSEAGFERLLGRLSAAGVDFVLVGGLAVNAWGVVRGTKDIDVVPDPDAGNLARLAKVVVASGGRVQSATALAGSAFSIAALLAAGERVNIETTLGSLDVVHGLPGVPSFQALRKRAVEVAIGDTRVAVCALEDLRAMKRAAGRTRDLADLEDLDTANPDTPGT